MKKVSRFMKKVSRYLALDLKICTAAIFLLACFNSNAQTPNSLSLNSEAAASSSISFSASSTLVIQSSKASLQQSSIALNVNRPDVQLRSSLISSSSKAVVENSPNAIAHSSVSTLTTVAPNTNTLTTATQATSSSTPTLKVPLVGISGVIKLTGKNGEILSPEGVIVNLEPTSAIDDGVATPEKHQYDVQMKEKTYLPKFMTVRKNDQLNFNNKDKIKHNVFSTSAGNGFDLGTYGEGTKNSTVLKTPGIVKVYCNIHPEMAFFVSVSQHNYSYITNESGAYEINNLPPGEYTLSAWHIRGEIQQVVNLKTSISKNNILINTESFVSSAHKNKFGEDYKIRPALFKDEFY